MAFSGSGGDKMRGSRSMSTGKPSPGISKREEHANQLEYMFEKTYNHIQELCRLLALEEKTLNTKVSDELLQTVLQRQDKILLKARNELKRESFGIHAPWGQTYVKNNKTSVHRGAGDNGTVAGVQKNHVVRHGSEGTHSSSMGDGNLSRSRCDSSNQSFHVSPFQGAVRDEEMFKRTGAIPKKYNYGQFMHGTPETINRSSADMEAIGHSRSKEDPGALRVSQSQHDSTYFVSQDDDEGGFQCLEDSELVRSQKMDPSWYGSLDRNFAKRRKAYMSDKQRRHTKAIGIMPWSQANETSLDSGKKISTELGPDEQYTFGLPHVANVHSSKLSTTILASLSHTLSPKSAGSRPQQYSYAPDINIGHQGSSSVLTDSVHMSTPKQHHSSTLLHGSPRSSMFVGQNRLPSPIPKHTPLTGLQDKKADSFSKYWDEANMDSRNSSVHERTRSALAVTGISPSTGSERIVGSLSNLQIADSASDVVDCGTSSKGEQISSVSKESTKPFEMADYYKYSTKFRSQHHSQSSDATSGSQNERSRFSSSSASSSSSAIDSGLSARSLILKNFFMQLPYDENVELLRGSALPGENNSWVPPHLKNWYNMDFKTQHSILENYVLTEEAATENRKDSSLELNSSNNIPSTSMQNLSTNATQLPASSQPVSSHDENGNNMSSTEQAPELPPRQPRERKDNNIENGRVSENKNQAWIMDTPTFV